MKLVLLLLAGFFVIATGLSIVRTSAWWVRVFDFPRGQIAVGGILILIVYAIFWDRSRWVETVLLGLLLASVVYQGWRMWPYTPLARKQVLPAREKGDDQIALLIANVLMTNRAADHFLALVERYDPDLVLTVETDDWWAEALAPLEARYPYTILRPLGNTYGMLLHARIPFEEAEVMMLVQDSIPSFHVTLALPSGRRVRFHALHPKPPAPQEARSTTNRDAELLLVGRMVKAHDAPTIVAGDLNDVAWSHTTRLFQQVSGLLDPRIGRGMYNTFSARTRLMRWPLDHVFHSDHFKLVHLERGPAWGSDHFPVYVALRLDPEAPVQQEAPEANGDEEREAAEKIEKSLNDPSDD